MILINYFARYREQLNLGGERLALTSELQTIEDVRQLLMARGEKWTEALGENNLMCALNQELCHTDRTIEDFDEIAFFPPVTGG